MEDTRTGTNYAIFFFLFMELKKAKHYIDFDLLKDLFITHEKSSEKLKTVRGY